MQATPFSPERVLLHPRYSALATAILLLGCGLPLSETAAAGIPEFNRHVISSGYPGAWSVTAADLDADGKADVLAASRTGNDISWWRNPGNGGTWSRQVLAADYHGAIAVRAADLDGDGDLDVLGAASIDDRVDWWENRAGDGSNWIMHAIAAGIDGVHSVQAVDLDGDGDPDIVGASLNANAVEWWENTDGTAGAWQEHSISTAVAGAFSVSAADLDGDGDQDVLAAALNGDRVAWWENGAGVWQEHTVADNIDGPNGVDAADLDGDGDLDILASVFNGDRILWWDNSSGDGSTWDGHVVADALDGPHAALAADVDADGDQDVLGVALNADLLGWWENTAADAGSWSAHPLSGSFDGARSVFGADLDGDGDVDILGAADFAGTITWWENLGRDSGYDVMDLLLLILQRARQTPR